MNTTLLFFALLVPLSGFIAWAGDKIGHRIGKRRQSLLGLRPRHTATLITILSGVGIAGATFLMMFLSSSSFRDVVARGTQLRRENADLQHDNSQLTEAIHTAGVRVRQLQTEAMAAEKVRLAVEKARLEAVKRKQDAEGKLTGAERVLVQAQQNLTHEKQKLGQTQHSLQAAERKVAVATTAVREARARREKAERAMRLVETRLKGATRDVAEAQEKVEKATGEFNLVVQEQKRRLEDQKSELGRLTLQIGQQTLALGTVQRQYEGEKRQAESQRTELERLTDEVAKLEERRQKLEERRAAAQNALDEVVRTTLALRSGQITYRVGEEVARLSIATGGSEWKNHNVLEGLLTVASRRAERRGARMGRDGIRAVWIPTQQVRDDDGKLVPVDEFNALHAAAKNIVGEKEEVVVVVTALGNTVVGEPVPVDIKTWRNPLILAAGAALGEITLDGSRSGPEIADTLFGFLRTTIHQRLIDAGTIPVSEQGDQTVGETSVDAVLRALDAVRAIRSRARVTVRAARDLRAADPVALEFEVRPVDDPPGSSARP